MSGLAGDANAKPEHADVSVGELSARRLSNDAGVGLVAASGIEGAVTGSLLLDHALDDEVTAELDAQVT